MSEIAHFEWFENYEIGENEAQQGLFLPISTTSRPILALRKWPYVQASCPCKVGQRHFTGHVCVGQPTNGWLGGQNGPCDLVSIENGTFQVGLTTNNKPIGHIFDGIPFPYVRAAAHFLIGAQEYYLTFKHLILLHLFRIYFKTTVCVITHKWIQS